MTRAALSTCFFSLVLAGLLVACPQSSVGGALRGATYAPSFEYIEREKLQSAMWRMADDVAAIDVALRGVPVDQVEQAEVVRLLEDISAAASGLSTPEGNTNHPMLDQHLATFLRDVEAARAAAAATPPSYFLAGSVTGACIHCHAGRSPRTTSSVESTPTSARSVFNTSTR